MLINAILKLLNGILSVRGKYQQKHVIADTKTFGVFPVRSHATYYSQGWLYVTKCHYTVKITSLPFNTNNLPENELPLFKEFRDSLPYTEVSEIDAWRTLLSSPYTHQVSIWYDTPENTAKGIKSQKRYLLNKRFNFYLGYEDEFRPDRVAVNIGKFLTYYLNNEKNFSLLTSSVLVKSGHWMIAVFRRYRLEWLAVNKH